MSLKGFVEGGISAVVAGCSTHPLDLIKVRLQLQGETMPLAFSPSTGYLHLPPQRLGPISLGLRIVHSQGFLALYSGVSATILRQSVYSTTSMGLYDTFKRCWTDPETKTMPLQKKIVAGLIAGGIGATIGNPADVAMIRMQADGRLSPSQRRDYKGVFDAITRISKQEGVCSLWRGSSLTVNRAMIVTAAQLATYDQIKEALLRNAIMEDGMGTHVTASLAAGIVAAVASNPVDVIKTRVMNMKVEVGRLPVYDGAIDCLLKTVKREGFKALYKGFLPTVSRQGPFTVVLFVTLEQVRKLLKDF